MTDFTCSGYLTLGPLLVGHVVGDRNDGHHTPDQLLKHQNGEKYKMGSSQLQMTEGWQLISTFRSHLSLGQTLTRLE